MHHDLVVVVTRLCNEWSRVQFPVGQEMCLFLTESRPAFGPTHHPVWGVNEGCFPGVKWSVCDTDHSAPSRVKVVNDWSYTSPPCDLMMCARIALPFVHIFSKQHRSTRHTLRLLKSLVVWKK